MGLTRWRQRRRRNAITTYELNARLSTRSRSPVRQRVAASRPGWERRPTVTMSAGVTEGPRVDPTERVSGPKARTPGDQKRDRSGGLPRLRNERLGTTPRRRLPVTPLFASMSREELEAQSARVVAHLRKSKPERGEMLSPPINELVTRRDSSRPSDAGRKAKSRLEPGASDLLGQVPVKPGRGLFSDIFADEICARCI